MDLNGIHHVTAVTAQIKRNREFYTGLLGLRLVKKSVNQDDTSAYHLFYADKLGSPGTDMTFFDWPQTGRDRRGADSISLTAFRITDQAAVGFWQRRLREAGVDTELVEDLGGRRMLRFDDPEGQRLALVEDGGAPFEGEIWQAEGIPAEMALRGFYASMLTVPALEYVDPILTQLLNMRRDAETLSLDGRPLTRYHMAGGGPGRELWVQEAPDLPPAMTGAGGVHHVAFRVADSAEQEGWLKRLNSVGLPVSPQIDRFYFKSIYFRISRGILFEIATDGPGFAADEDLATLGERLALPPFLEPQRAQIEAGLKPI